MKTKILGKPLRNKVINKNMLEKIKRYKSSSKFGMDIWNIYDFMYLDNLKIPVLAVLEIKIPPSSDFIIESKSMKLYLNSFYNKSFLNSSLVSSEIKNELEDLLNDEISVRFINKFSKEPNFFLINKSKADFTPAKKILKFNGFRSICPVTSQPDFANIYIYSSKKIDLTWLKNYLISFKDHGGFHEQCIDQIFEKLSSFYENFDFEICGRFQRRGGIDINPVRGSIKKKLFFNFREFNQ